MVKMTTKRLLLANLFGNRHKICAQHDRNAIFNIKSCKTMLTKDFFCYTIAFIEQRRSSSDAKISVIGF